MKTTTPQLRVRRWHTYLVVWRLHRWAGLGLGAVIVALSLTGGLLVIHHDLERLLYPERHVITPPPPSATGGPASRVPLVPLVRELQKAAPAGYRPLRMEPGHGPAESDKIVFVAENGTDRWSVFIHPSTGAVLWRGADQALLTPWLLHLHMHLQIGRWGYVITGLAAVAMTLLTLSGVWITRDKLRALLKHPFRLRLGWRVALSDLHKWVGMASLYFCFVLGATGVWFAILIVPGQLAGEKERELAPPFDLARLAPVEPAIAATLARFPDAEFARLIFPWDEGVNVQVRVLHRDAPVWEKLSRIDFDPVTGAMLRIRDAQTASTSEKWQAILGPLHFGLYGTSLTKWLYAIGGFTPALLTVTGFAIWWLRRRKTAPARASLTPARPPAAALKSPAA